MTSFEILFDNFVSVEEKDFNGYLLAKADTMLGYLTEIPRLKDVIMGLFVKTVAADGVLTEEEIGYFDILKTVFRGERLDVEAFIAGMVQFVKEGADVSEFVAAYWMLPEYVRDDIVFFLFVLSSVAGELATEELEFVASLCE